MQYDGTEILYLTDESICGIQYFFVVLNTTAAAASSRTAPTAEPGCAATAAARQPVKLPSLGSAGAIATFHCSWQAVADKASILRLPGKLDCLGWSWLQMR